MSKTEMEQGESFDNTIEISLETIRARAVKGVAVLTGRTFFLQIIALVAGILLGTYLDPPQFGVFFVVSAVVNFLAYFSDVGLAAALIQTKDEVKEADLKTTFTVQQILVITIIGIVLLSSPFLRNHYGLSVDGVYLLYALAFSLFLSSLKTIPSILLERELNFSKLIMPQVLENIIYHVVAVVLAWKGFGINAFTYAVLARGIVGLVAMYILRPWTPGFALNRKSLHRLLKYGLPYQANTFLATIKDDGLTAFLGGILTSSGLGYLGWAQKWAKYPLRLFLDNILKVTFPAFSRMQDEKKYLADSVTKSIFFLCFLIFPTLAGFLILAPNLVYLVPRYEKWIPALVPLYIIGIDTAFAAVTTQLTNLLNSIGKITITFRLMIMWTVLAWFFIPILAIKFDVVGAAVGYAIVSSSSIIAIIVTKKYVNFSLTESVLPPLVGTGIMSIVVYLLKVILPVNYYSIFLTTLIGGLTYFLVIKAIVGDRIVQDVKKFTKNFLSNK